MILLAAMMTMASATSVRFSLSLRKRRQRPNHAFVRRAHPLR